MSEEKEKMLNLIYNSIEQLGETCEICTKMGYKCPVDIPENADSSFKPDFSLCNFKTRFYKTLTI